MASSAGADIPENTRVSVTGRHLDVGDALRGQVEAQMRQLASKYFGRAADATVTFSREGPHFRCNIRFRVAADIDFDGQGSRKDAHGALAVAAERVDKQLRRTKRAKREDKPGNPNKDNVFRLHGERIAEADGALGLPDGDGDEDFGGEGDSVVIEFFPPAGRGRDRDLPVAAE